MKNIASACAPIISTVILLVGVSGCQTLQQLANLREVKFSLDAVSDLNLAGVRLDDVRSYEDLGLLDVGRLTTALARGRMPLSFELQLGAHNPEENGVAARLVRMDWMLLLDDRETIGGVFDQTVVIAPGERSAIPFAIELDLLEFFSKSARDLAELGLSLAGQGGEPKNVKLRATPTIDTAIGPIRYPRPITIVSQTVG